MLDSECISPPISPRPPSLTPSILITTNRATRPIQPTRSPYSTSGSQPSEVSSQPNPTPNITQAPPHAHLKNNLAIGDMLALPKNTAHTRIYFQNLNGITITNPSTWDSLCYDIQQLDLDISLWAEHNLDSRKPWVNDTLHTTARKHFGLGSYDIQTVSTPVNSHSSYKPGGVMSFIQGPTRGRILERGQDPLGRWVYIKLRRNQGPPLVIIVTYQVVHTDPTKSGPTTYATQLYAQYLAQDRPQPHKLRYHHSEDFVHLVKQFQSRGELVIVAGDLNEVLGSSNSGMTRLFHDCRLVDPIMYRHGHNDFTTYQRGSKVLDYILVDPALLPLIAFTGYEPFGNHIISNHRGVYLDIDTARCFGSTIQPLLPIQLRDISSRRSHQIAPYFKHKKQHLEDHAWFKQIRTLQHNMNHGQPNNKLAEKLYARLITASQVSGKQLKRFPPAPYSPTIARLRQIRRFLKLELTQYKTGVDLSAQLRTTRAKLGNISHPIPATQRECEQMLLMVTRKLRNAIAKESTTTNLREQHQTTLIDKYTMEGNTKMANRIRGMQRAEEVSRVFQHCRAARNLTHEGGLSYLLVPANPQDNPKTCKEWKRVDCPKNKDAPTTQESKTFWPVQKLHSHDASSRFHHEFHSHMPKS